MCNWMNSRMEMNSKWINHIWFTDEAYFHLNGAVKHNNII